MGEVYLAEDSRLHRKVVLKILNAGTAHDPRSAARLLREARAVAALDHPNICSLYEIGSESPLAGQEPAVEYLVMQYLDGETLASRLRHGRVPFDEALAIAIDVTSALAYAHSRGVLHRDIKPQNIMVLADGATGSPRAKLLDFGIAKTTNPNTQADTEAALTREGSVVGTLEYMAPEVLAANPATMQSDIFSLALVVYELVTGRHPFRADTAVVTVSSILTREYPRIPASSERRLAALDGVLAKALSREPKMRHATAADLLVDLKRVRHSTAPLDRGPNRRARAGLWVALGVLVLAGLIAAASLWNRGRPALAPSASAAAAAAARSVDYWFDVRQPRAADSQSISRSLGDTPFERGSKFRVTVNSASAALVYLLNDDGRDLSLVYPLAQVGTGGGAAREVTHTTDWLGFSGSSAVERLWIVWSPNPLPALDALVQSANEHELGVVRDPARAASLRAWLATTEGHDVREDRGSNPPRVTLSFDRSPLVRQITLHPEDRSRQ